VLALAVTAVPASTIARRTGPYVTLRARGRIARYHGSPICVEVSQGWGEPTLLSGAPKCYAHPEVRFRTINSAGETSAYGGLDVTLRFQKHTHRDSDQYSRKGPSGCMAPSEPDPGPWSCAYACSIEAPLKYPAHHKAVARVMELVTRAGSNVYEHGPRALQQLDCELATLIVGLRRIGVEVRIYSKRVERLRAYRT
jgi:hypothetical protein